MGSACRISKLKWKMGKETGGKKNGGPPLLEVKRDGPVQLPAPAAACVRHLQELRGPFARSLHGWQWCRDAGQGHLLRAQRGCRRWRQEKVGCTVQVFRIRRRWRQDKANCKMQVCWICVAGHAA